MIELFEQIRYWHWLIFGVALLILEMFAPGAVFMWLGISALGVGGLLLALPDTSWELQFLVFATLSVVSVLAWKLFAKRSGQTGKDDEDTMNQRGRSLIGKEFVIEQPLAGGSGRMRVGDSYWRMEGPDLPAGSRVRVIDADGATLKVGAADRP